MLPVAYLVLLQANVFGSYRLYSAAMAGASYVNAPAGTLTMRAGGGYAAPGGSGKYALSGSTARFLSGPYKGGTAIFSRRAGHLRVNVVTHFPGRPNRKLRLFGNRS